MLLHQAVDAGLAATRAEVAVDLDCGQMRNIHLSLKPDISPDDRWRIPMKTMILAAVAALSLGVGAAYAQGVPAGYQDLTMARKPKVNLA